MPSSCAAVCASLYKSKVVGGGRRRRRIMVAFVDGQGRDTQEGRTYISLAESCGY